jgi:thiamine-phosphate pyrophosphorylase
MRIELKTPIIYLITSGQATNQTLTVDCERILVLIETAVAAHLSLIQLREKNLSARALYELTRRAAALTAQSSTRLLVNDRADIARAAGADGVHLTSRSLETGVVRATFGEEFLIGVSTHSLDEARAARDGGANFAVYGPVFETPAKSTLGSPLGVDNLRQATFALNPFCLIALGGITLENAALTFEAGASGVAAIRAFSDPRHLNETVRAIRDGAVML